MGFPSWLIDRNEKNKRNQWKFKWLYCDNAKFHDVPALAELYSKVNVLFSARYSPFLNPIEELFGNWKYYFRRRKDTLFKDIGFDIVEASMQISKRSCLGFYKHALKFHLLSLFGNKIDD